MLFDLPKTNGASIKVIGVGGGGGNAVNHMYKHGIVGVDFAICNTDKQAMEMSDVPVKIQLGPTLTDGKGAGSLPSTGREACLESTEDLRAFLGSGTDMLFVAAGMGGGTGTGAAPVVAKIAQELDILTVGIVTMPFGFEGNRRKKYSIEGMEELKKNVDTLICVSNDKLRKMFGNLKASEAFGHADNVLTTAAKAIAEIITVPGFINIDFEDVNTVMRNSGVAIMGTGLANGESRALEAVEMAMKSPLLEDSQIQGAKHILLNITSSQENEITMDEISEITDYIQDEAGEGTDLIWGNCVDDTLGDEVIVTVIATGFEIGANRVVRQAPKEVVRVDLNETSTQTQSTPQVDNTPPVAENTDQVFELGYAEEERTIEVEFDNNSSIHSQNYGEPFIQEESASAQPVQHNYSYKEDAQRARLNKTHTLKELEEIPSFQRQNVQLHSTPSSSENKYSGLTLNEDKPYFSRDNSFLHDNVD